MDRFASDFTHSRTYKSSGRQLHRSGAIRLSRNPLFFLYEWTEPESHHTGEILWKDGVLRYRGITVSSPTVEEIDKALSGEAGTSCASGIYISSLLLDRSELFCFGHLLQQPGDNRSTLTFVDNDITTELQVSEAGLILAVARRFSISGGPVEEFTRFDIHPD